MDSEPRRGFGGLCRDDVPQAPGVYALYRDGRRVYVGKAADLCDRVWGNHSRRGQSLGASALRRNVAEMIRPLAVFVTERLRGAAAPMQVDSDEEARDQGRQGWQFRVEGNFVLPNGQVGVYGTVESGTISYEDRLRGPARTWDLLQIENLRDRIAVAHAGDESIRLILGDARQEDLPAGTILHAV